LKYTSIEINWQRALIARRKPHLAICRNPKGKPVEESAGLGD
jgi:hypothetical protein